MKPTDNVTHQDLLSVLNPLLNRVEELDMQLHNAKLRIELLEIHVEKLNSALVNSNLTSQQYSTKLY